MLGRRSFLIGAAGLVLVPRAVRAAVPDAAGGALEKSPFVYISPLRADGSESACHGEVWFAWLDGRAVIITARTSWKSRSVERGLRRARVWVGDFGRWKNLGIASDAFRKGPSFEALAERQDDAALLERLLAEYERKYPAEMGRWRERFRTGFASGERVLIGYTPA